MCLNFQELFCFLQGFLFHLYMYLSFQYYFKEFAITEY